MGVGVVIFLLGLPLDGTQKSSRIPKGAPS